LLAVAAVGGLTLVGPSPSSRFGEREAAPPTVALQRSADPSPAPEAGDRKPSEQRANDRASDVTVTWQGELLGVTAHHAPLRDVLESITRSTGVTFSGGDADEPVTAEVGPLAIKELVPALLAHTSYGYLYVDAIVSTSGSVPARVILIGNGKSRVAAGPVPKFGMAAARSAEQPSVDAAPDPEALREQRTVESLLEACKSQGCDSS
jgi:hypothetical protein